MSYILKGGGMVCIVATCSAVGIVLRKRLIDRADCLEKVIAMLDYFSAQISYARMPVGEIVAHMARQSQFATLGFLQECSALLLDGVMFPQAWRRSAALQRHLLSKDDYERLVSIGDNLGITDAKEQQKTIELYARMFEKSYETARAECTAHAKMYLSLGVLVGIGLAILMV